MNFIIRLLKVKSGLNVLQVIVKGLTKSTHFLPIKDTTSTDQLRKLYVQKIVKLHGITKAIVSDKDIWFMSTFWKVLQRS